MYIYSWITEKSKGCLFVSTRDTTCEDFIIMYTVSGVTEIFTFWAHLKYEYCFSRMAIYIIKRRGVWDRLIFMMVILIMIRRYIYIETASLSLKWWLTREINTKITLSRAHKPFATRVHTLCYMNFKGSNRSICINRIVCETHFLRTWLWEN